MIILKSNRPNTNGESWYFKIKKGYSNNRAEVIISKKYKTKKEAYEAFLEYRKKIVEREM